MATSCGDKKDPAPEPGEPKEVKLPAASTAGFTKLRDDALANLKSSSKHTVDPQGWFDFETAKKVNGRIFFYQLMKKDSTELDSGSEIEFSLAEIYDRGTMVVANMPLMGQNNNNDGKLEPLATGGLLFFGAEQDGEDLLYDDNSSITVWGLETSFTGGEPDDNMMNILWRGVRDAGSGNQTWTQNPPDGVNSIGFAMFMMADYEVNPRVIGWLNVGWFYQHNGDKTKITVSVPDGYDNKNAAVYLAYEKEPNLLAQLYDYDATGRSFSEPVGFVPEDKKVHVIFTSESEGKFVHAIKTVTVKANEAVTFEHKNLAIIETAALVTKINDLQ